MTYNLHEFRGRGGFDPRRSRRAVESLDGDVVALQEFRAERLDDSALQSLGIWGRELGMTAVAGFTLRRGLSRYGSAVLTRLPVHAVRRHDVTIDTREPRSVLELDLDWGGRRLRVLSTHLGLRWRERVRQIRRLAAILDEEPTRATVLLGDFNDWTPGALQMRPVWRRLAHRSQALSFPSKWPVVALDRIATSSHLQWRRSHAIHTGAYASVSDHLPVWAEVEPVGADLPRDG